jgi:hypothetical protein
MFVAKRSLPVVATAIALSTSALRAEETLRDSKLICDTVEQVEAYVKADESGQPNPMATVNATGSVCGFGSIAYLKGQKLKELNTKHGVLEVVEILVVGQGADSVKPYKQISVFAVKGESQ